MNPFAHQPLARLIAPVSVETMMQEHWDKRVLYVPGAENKFDELFDLEQLRDLVLEADDRVRQRDELHFRAIYDHLAWVESRRGGPPQSMILPSQIPFLLELGAHIGIEKLERAGSAGRVLRAVSAALKEQLSWSGPLLSTCWVSRRGAHLSPHFDPAASIVLQLSGTWRWRWQSDVAMSWPPGTAKALEGNKLAYLDGNNAGWEHAADTLDDSQTVEATLTAGDLLYVPAGAYHATETVGDETSVALHFVFGPSRVMPLLTEILEPLLLEHPQWRNVPARLNNDGTLPDELREFFAERLQELSSLAAGLDPSRLHRSWKDAIALHGSTPPEYVFDPTRPTQVRVRRADRLVFADSTPVTTVVTPGPDGEKVTLRADHREVTFDDPQLVPFAREVFRNRGGFTAGDAVRFGSSDEAWPWEPVRELLQHFVDTGLLVVDRAAA